MQYETEEEAKETVLKYSENPSVEFAEPDRIAAVREKFETEEVSDAAAMSVYGSDHKSWEAAALKCNIFNDNLLERAGNDVNNLPEIVVGVLDGVSAKDAVYDGTAQKGYTGEPKNDLYTGEYEIMYTGRNSNNYSSVNAPAEAGDYTVTFTIPNGEKYEGSVSVDFSIVMVGDSTESTTESTTEEGSTESTTESTTEESSTESTTKSTTEDEGTNKDNNMDSSKIGDVDGDGYLTVNDASCLLMKVLNNSFEMPIEKIVNDYMKYADVDCNGELTASDAAIISQKALNGEFIIPVVGKN